MLTKIENSEILTVKEFKEKYANDWFWYVNIGPEENWTYLQYKDRQVKVLFLADSKKELVNIPVKERMPNEYSGGGVEWGINVNPEPGLSIGGLEVEWV